MRMLFALVFSMFADYLLKSEKMSRTNLRKLATAVCEFCILLGARFFLLIFQLIFNSSNFCKVASLKV